MLIAFTHDAGSISLVAPIRGTFNEVLNRRIFLQCGPSSGRKKRKKEKQGPLLIAAPNNWILGPDQCLFLNLWKLIGGATWGKVNPGVLFCRGFFFAGWRRVQISGGEKENLIHIGRAITLALVFILITFFISTNDLVLILRPCPSSRNHLVVTRNLNSVYPSLNASAVITLEQVQPWRHTSHMSRWSLLSCGTSGDAWTVLKSQF